MQPHSHIEIGFQVYAVEGGEEFGAVRGYVPNANALVIYIENAGDFVVPLEDEDVGQSWLMPWGDSVDTPPEMRWRDMRIALWVLRS